MPVLINIYILLHRAWKGPWVLSRKLKTKGCLSVLVLAHPGPAGVAMVVNPFTTVTDAADLATTFADTTGVTEALGNTESTAAGRLGRRYLFMLSIVLLW